VQPPRGSPYWPSTRSNQHQPNPGYLPHTCMLIRDKHKGPLATGYRGLGRHPVCIYLGETILWTSPHDTTYYSLALRRSACFWISEVGPQATFLFLVVSPYIMYSQLVICYRPCHGLHNIDAWLFPIESQHCAPGVIPFWVSEPHELACRVLVIHYLRRRYPHSVVFWLAMTSDHWLSTAACQAISGHLDWLWP
jgi:hypothetical protein